MHLADAFIQSDFHCIQVSFTFLSALAFPVNRTHDLGVVVELQESCSHAVHVNTSQSKEKTDHTPTDKTEQVTSDM